MRIQSDKKLYVGGEFTSYDGESSNRIVRLFSDGRKDNSFNVGSGFNDAVRGIVIQNDGKILVGGHFTDYNGTTANRIIRLNPDGSRDTSFNIGSGFNAQIRTMEMQEDGKILVGGAMVNYNGTNIYRIARLNTNGSLDASFNVGLGFNNNIRAIAFQDDGKIILGGGFLVYSGTVTNRIIRLNPDGSRDTSFIIGSGFNEQINVVDIDANGKILVGGFFTGYNGISVNKIARLNTNGSLDSSFAIGSGFNGQVNGFIRYNDKIIVGGGFTTYNSTPANGIIRLNSDGSRDTSFDIGVGCTSSSRFFMIQEDRKILVGGDFTGYNGTSFGRLMRLHGESHISLMDTDNEDAIHAEFTSKGYILSGSLLSGSAPMVFIDTEG
ncbi:MAG TPA: delta-60 repeat domain-containing protein, partial [Candidatus Absconditabacterales bacterium]|nr:delta-60 repeat domain-containing protein [Candidatus Absconditabacterales bacterium]